MDKTEYNRLYYYKRDPAKLAEYRKKYQKKLKMRAYNRLKSRVQKAEKYARNHGGRYENKETELLVKNFRKPKTYKSKWYANNKEKLLARLNNQYHEKKLKEFVDSVVNNKNDSEGSN